MVDNESSVDRWSERVRQHEASSWVTALANLIDPLNQRYPQAEARLVRLLGESRCSFAKHLEASDPRLVTASMLNRVQDALQHLVDYLNISINADATVTDWQIPIDRGDALVDAFAGWPRPGPSEILSEQEERLVKNEVLSQKALREIEERTTEVVNQLRETISAEQVKMDESIRGSRKAEEVALSTRIASQVELIGQQLPTLQTQDPQLEREEFASAEESRRKEAPETQIEALNAARVASLRKVENKGAKNWKSKKFVSSKCFLVTRLHLMPRLRS